MHNINIWDHKRTITELCVTFPIVPIRMDSNDSQFNMWNDFDSLSLCLSK